MTNKYFKNSNTSDQAPLSAFTADTYFLAQKGDQPVALGNYREESYMIANEAANWSTNATISWVSPGLLRITGAFTSYANDNNAPMGFFPEGFKPERFTSLQQTDIDGSPFVIVVINPGEGNYGSLQCFTPANISNAINVDMLVAGNMNQSIND